MWTMTIDAVLDAIAERDATLCVENGRLRYVGPSLAADDTLLDAIDAHRVVLTELFTYAPGRRCRWPDCYRLRASGDSTMCVDHRANIDALVQEWPE